MKTRNRRKHFLIDKALQFHYLFYIVTTLAIVSAVGMTGIYLGIWGSAIKAFSAESLRESMVTAAQLSEYEQARRPLAGGLSIPSIRIFQETSLLSERQKEIIREMMEETNQKMIGLGVLLLIFIGWGSISLTHKIAGPIFKLGQQFQELGNGNLTVRIKLRKFDEVHYLADQFNEMATKLDGAIAKIKKIAHQAPRGSGTEELKKELEQFKTTSD